jgi:hypothetical protein
MSDIQAQIKHLQKRVSSIVTAQLEWRGPAEKGVTTNNESRPYRKDLKVRFLGT